MEDRVAELASTLAPTQRRALTPPISLLVRPSWVTLCPSSLLNSSSSFLFSQLLTPFTYTFTPLSRFIDTLSLISGQN